MTMTGVIPRKFFDAVAVPSAVTLDGELLAAGVVELASRPDAVGPDKDIAFALRESLGAVQRRIWWRRSGRAASSSPAA